MRAKAHSAELDRRGIEPIVMTPQALGRYIESEIGKWTDVLKAANITME